MENVILMQQDEDKAREAMDSIYYKKLSIKKEVECYDINTLHDREKHLHLREKNIQFRELSLHEREKKIYCKEKDLEEYIKEKINEHDKNKFYVAVDKVGFIGAFSTKEIADRMLLPYIKTVPFMYYIWKIDTKCTKNDNIVWILPYKVSNLIAYASNNKEKVEETQQELLRVNLAFNDDVKYWEAELDKITALATFRLNESINSLM